MNDVLYLVTKYMWKLVMEPEYDLNIAKCLISLKLSQ